MAAWWRWHCPSVHEQNCSSARNSMAFVICAVSCCVVLCCAAQLAAQAAEQDETRAFTDAMTVSLGTVSGRMPAPLGCCSLPHIIFRMPGHGNCSSQVCRVDLQDCPVDALLVAAATSVCSAKHCQCLQTGQLVSAAFCCCCAAFCCAAWNQGACS